MHLLSRLAERALTSRLAAIHDGRLVLFDGNRRAEFGDPASDALAVHVHDPRFYAAVAFGGSVSAGEAYADGWWSTDDLTGVVRLLLRNQDVLDGIDSGWSRLAVPARKLLHALNRNTRTRSRRNIAAHYDLSNEFFATFLDETMTYSCALFERPDASLASASEAKYARIAALLDLKASDRVIEIGTGWGGFAMHAARNFGCHVTTTTISAQQESLARERVAAAGLTDRITILSSDYRDLTGRFDKLVSIEMIEAVGHQHYDRYFEKCHALLAPHGRAVIQAITIRDDRYESARREVDFIKRHIFPGSCIPSRQVLRSAAETNGLRQVRIDEMGLHYAETLRRWRDNMHASRARMSRLGFDERFQRLWEFYLCYCEGGFLARAIGTAQIVFTHASSSDIPVRVPDVPPFPATGVVA